MLVDIFYHVDEFCKVFETILKSHSIKSTKKRRNRKRRLSLSEIMTICIFYHLSGYKDFKSYYKNYVLEHMKSDFEALVSYNRFIELKKETVMPLFMFLKLYALSRCTGISFIDSFCLKASHNRRIYSHKVFKGLAKRGKTSVGWFYGFKVHFVINHLGEIIDFYLTSGNIADNNVGLLEKLTESLFGKLFGDKGYIVNKSLLQKLYDSGLQIITKVRTNMKCILMNVFDKAMLKKRGTIESVIGIFKQSLGIEHSRHRSVFNFLSHIFSALAAYCFRPNKPSIRLNNNFLLSPP